MGETKATQATETAGLKIPREGVDGEGASGG
jgi:hypothetical protein